MSNSSTDKDRAVDEIYDEAMPIMHDEETCNNCQNKDVDCDHCTRNEFYEEPSDCYLPKDEEDE